MTLSRHIFLIDLVMLIFISSLAIAGYSSASILQSRHLFGGHNASIVMQRSLAIMAVLVHGLALHQLIDVSGGQNLSLVNLLSQFAWLMAFIVLLLECFAQRNLSLFIFPLCAISLVAALLFPTQHVVNTKENLSQLFHIVLAVITFSVVGLTALQALLIHHQEHLLKSKLRWGFLRSLPSLEAMEQFLFRLIASGWILLSALIISSLLCFSDQITHAFLSKFLLTSAAWCVFTALLMGRFFLEWRGQVVVRWSLVGFGLLLVLVLLNFAFYG